MESRHSAHETARMRLANYRERGESARTRAAAHAAKVCSIALAVEQVGVWIFEDDRLVCITQYEQQNNCHTSGHVLAVNRYPTYMRALRRRCTVHVEDAMRDPMTQELADDYLAPRNIASMLDAPIVRDDEVIGVVCHEHLGQPRRFSERDIEFANAIAEMLSLVFEQAERLELEALLQEEVEQRLNHQKMAALGHMATAVAHDFNNVLTTITLSMAQIQEALPRELLPTIRDIDSSVGVARRLVKQLLTFGKRGDSRNRKAISLRTTIEALRPVLQTAVGKRIQLMTSYPSDDLHAVIDAGRLEQILLNLSINSRDAIHEGGRIDIVLRPREEADDVPEGHLVLEVRDDGRGMSEATMERLFEPFYTTRADGTGLGLATVYGIVQAAGGTIRAYSRLGVGTTMRISLPRTYPQSC